jgi:hypothetical protein
VTNPKITTTFSGFSGGITMVMVNGAIVYWLASQTGAIKPAPIATRPQMSVEALAVAQENNKVLQELHSGEAPRKGIVPWWHVIHQDFRDLIRAVENNTNASLVLAAELEDEEHRRPPYTPQHTADTSTTPAPDDLTLIQRIVRWWNS